MAFFCRLCANYAHHFFPFCAAYFRYFVNKSTYKLIDTRESNYSAKINKSTSSNNQFNAAVLNFANNDVALNTIFKKILLYKVVTAYVPDYKGIRDVCQSAAHKQDELCRTW